MAERTLVEEDTFKESRARLKVHCQQLDEALDEITIAIARNPEYFPYVPPGKELRRCRTREFPNVPAYDILFTYDDKEVRLWYVDLADRRSDPD